MQHFIEGLDNHAKRILILTDLAKEYNVSDDLVLIEIENSRGKLLARMTCEKQRLKEIVALVNNPF